MVLGKGNQVFSIKFKKPGQYLREVFSDEGPVHLLAVSPDDRYILYRLEERRELRVYDQRDGARFSKIFPFVIEEVIVSPFMEFSEAIRRIYIIALSAGDNTTPPVRELYMYDYPRRSLTAISTAQDTDISLYLRNR